LLILPKELNSLNIYYKYILIEKELIASLKQGEASAFKVLVENYQDRVYYSVLNILHNATEAEDTAQETFIQVYESISGFKEESSLATWIYRIAIRKALEKIRKQKNRQRLHSIVPWWMPSEEKSVDAAYLNPGINNENKEKATLIFKAISELPHNQRVAFTLIRVQGMKHEEVSEIMQLSIKAVESLLSRAKENLKNKLKHYYNS
jgi:RNA polymerase sigma factor (sigma-70 family)